MSDQDKRRPVIVLVVEDEPLQRLTLVEAIEEQGYEVVDARNADTAIAVLESRSDIRLLVSDIQMPHPLDGVKLAALVRDRHPPIEIILLSAGRPPSPSEMPERAEFMPKPLDMPRLFRSLKRLTERN